MFVIKGKHMILTFFNNKYIYNNLTIRSIYIILFYIRNVVTCTVIYLNDVKYSPSVAKLWQVVLGSCVISYNNGYNQIKGG